MTLTDVQTVRLLIGDEDADLLDDSQVNFYIAKWPGNLTLASADAAEAIAAKFSQDYDVGADGQELRRTQRVAHYRLLAADLRRRGGPYSVRAVGEINYEAEGS